ncbi:MAG: helix-turn-helix domain-containing protein [Methylococcaceae bacterium]
MGQNYSQLNQKERDQIAIYRSKCHSFSEIGEVLGRKGSTISREYNRNITEEGSYLPTLRSAKAILDEEKPSSRNEIKM